MTENILVTCPTCRELVKAGVVQPKLNKLPLNSKAPPFPNLEIQRTVATKIKTDGTLDNSNKDADPPFQE